MELLKTAYSQIPTHFNAGNGQPIREALLRLAVKYCEDYATDILILLDQLDLDDDFTIFIGF